MFITFSIVSLHFWEVTLHLLFIYLIVKSNLFFHAELPWFFLIAQTHRTAFIAAKLTTKAVVARMFFVFAISHYCITMHTRKILRAQKFDFFNTLVL